jgi:hypothetical protein
MGTLIQNWIKYLKERHRRMLSIERRCWKLVNEIWFMDRVRELLLPLAEDASDEVNHYANNEDEGQ